VLAVATALLLCAAAVALVLGPLRRIQTEHTIAGRFGEPPREALIAQWCDLVVRTAERYERLDHFRRRLAARAFTGTPLHIDPATDGWCTWRFADGEVWQVRHERGPTRSRGHARLIVEGAVEAGDRGLAVRTYVPGRRDVVLPVVDARAVVA
jgi:hypothetical protein